MLGVTENWWIVGAPLSHSALVENKDTIQTKKRKERGRERRDRQTERQSGCIMEISKNHKSTVICQQGSDNLWGNWVGSHEGNLTGYEP